jgi:hypothetical protein
MQIANHELASNGLNPSAANACRLAKNEENVIIPNFTIA